ncbi:hypothetical protein IID27_00865 [Patescibacteria group bacterium]|nr:hypothetical protein [Patescibacteria group bacterium]
MIIGIRRMYQFVVSFLGVLFLAPIPWLSMGVLSVIGISVEEDIPIKYWVVYWGAVFLSLVMFLFIWKRYPEKIPKKLRTKKKM